MRVPHLWETLSAMEKGLQKAGTVAPQAEGLFGCQKNLRRPRRIPTPRTVRWQRTPRSGLALEVGNSGLGYEIS